MVAPVTSAPISVPPPRPRLKRSHPTEPTAADDIGSGLSLPPQPIAVPVAASPTALPTGAIVAAPWSTARGGGGGGTGLDPIHELAELQQDNLGLPDGLALGLDLSGSGSGQGRGGGGDVGDIGADAAAERRAAKRIRVAPDHEAFGRLSLDRPPTSPTTSPLPAQTFPAGPSSPQSAVPPHLLRQPSQPLPTPPLGSLSAFAPSPVTSNPLRSPPRQQFINSSPPAPQPPTQHAAFSSPTLTSASLPSAPPTSPVQPAAFPGGPTRAADGFSPPLAVNAHPPGSGGVLPTVPWGQSTFFSPPPPPGPPAPAAPSVQNISPPPPVPAQPFSAPPAGEIEMGSANASSWDLDPHRIYVASLEDEEEGGDADKSATAATTTTADEQQQRLRLNEVVARRAAEEASALPAALIAQLEREAAKAREGSLVLYRPPPWAAAARRTSLHDDATTFSQQRELEKHEESWREFERERQRVERDQELEDHHLDADDEEVMSDDDAGGTGFDGETLVGGDEGGMDVDMEL
ncbi:hypothetical protein JCM8115_005589 [Rhodotorula mucilaginosa]|nr:hypothetical protein B0A53_03769 [Rhodotorula sp. CCFEE 5036]